VIKPVVRPSYGVLPQINESADGFQETVSFEEVNTYTPPSPLRTGRNTPVNAEKLDVGVKTSIVNPENNKSPVTSPTEKIVSRRRPVRQSIRQPDRFSGENRVSAPAVDNNNRGVYISGRKAVNQHVAGEKSNRSESISGKKVMKQHAAGETSEVAKKISPISNARIQTKSDKKNIQPEVIRPRLSSVFTDTVRKDLITRVSLPSSPKRTDVSDRNDRTRQTSSPQKGQEAIVRTRDNNKIPSAQSEIAIPRPAIPQRNRGFPRNRVQGKSQVNIPESQTLVPEQPEVLVQTAGRVKSVYPDVSIKREKRTGKEGAYLKTAAAHTPMPVPLENSPSTSDVTPALSPDLVLLKNNEPLESNRQGYDVRQKSAAEAAVIYEEPLESNRQRYAVKQSSAVEAAAKFAPEKSPGRSIAEVTPGGEGAPPPNIRVTIGRVEIRAVQEPQRQAARPVSSPRKPAVSLDAYLKARNKEKR
jgi:hypothetical protein